MKHLKEGEIKERVDRWESDRWRSELERKETLSIYRTWKTEIREEGFYENSYRSVIMFRCRTNTLKLTWRNRYMGGDVRCCV
jgi:hypothetical protein